MDYRVIIEIALGIAAFFGGVWVNNVQGDHKRLEERFNKHLETAVTKDDFKASVDDIKHLIERLFDELKNKVDK